MDYIYFGGSDVVLYFELTVSKDVSASKFPKLEDDGRLTSILNSMSKWFGLNEAEWIS
jgi:hypothetical protein